MYHLKIFKIGCGINVGYSRILEIWIKRMNNLDRK